MRWRPNLKGLDRKKIISIAIILMLIGAGGYGVKHFVKSDDGVKFEVMNEEAIPQKLQEILPRYKNLERALACKLEEDGVVYVIVTRGEKPSGGYEAKIDAIEKSLENEKEKLIVYATFKDPKPGEVVEHAPTYPCIVVKTNIKELPDKVELKVKYNE